MRESGKGETLLRAPLPRPRSGRLQGFTLVEVLVALTLFSLIMVALVGGLRTLGSSADAAEQRIHALDDMRAIQRYFRRAFDLQYPALIDREGEAPIAFRGESDELGWVGALPARHAPAGLFWQRIYLEQPRRDAAGRLVLCYASFPDERAPSLPRDCEQHVLQSDVQALELRYQSDPAAEWINRWDEPRALPYAVRVRLRVDGRWWPDQILRPNAVAGGL